MMNCLVTGGAGFIGSHLVEALVRRGDKVRVVDNFRSGIPDNLARVQKDIEFVRTDLSDLRALYELSRGIQVVFHLAVSPIAPYAATDLIHPGWVYVPELLNVLIAARVAKVARVVYSSCASVYGQLRTPRARETDPLLPVSRYGLAKLAGEQHCVGYNVLHGLETVRLRYFTAIGPRQPLVTPHGQEVILILKAMLAGESPVLEDNTSEDFVSVHDIVHATLLAADAPRVAGKVYNIGSGHAVTRADIVRVANELLGTRITPIYRHPLPPGPLLSTADINRAETELGFCPSVDLRRAMTQLIDFLRHGDLPVHTRLDAPSLQDLPHTPVPRPLPKDKTSSAGDAK